MSQEQKEPVLQNSEPQAVDVTVRVGGESRAERFLGTFDQISRFSNEYFFVMKHGETRSLEFLLR